jgi:hypothetical protein
MDPGKPLRKHYITSPSHYPVQKDMMCLDAWRVPIWVPKVRGSSARECAAKEADESMQLPFKLAIGPFSAGPVSLTAATPV